MNSAEHIVESYFRLCLGCFTLSDKKVPKGNNRQLDILAYNVKKRTQYHVEVKVTHRENWCPTVIDLGVDFEKKFFGAPPERKGKSDGATDFEKGKSYFEHIKNAYTEIGFDPKKVFRVWVCWIVQDENNKKPISIDFRSKYLKKTFPIQILSLRDFILPALEKAIGTANYDDEVLRTLGFIKQRHAQGG